jgi:hypothetical protein
MVSGTTLTTRKTNLEAVGTAMSPIYKEKSLFMCKTRFMCAHEHYQAAEVGYLRERYFSQLLYMGAPPDHFGRPLNQEKKKIEVQNIVEEEEHYRKHIADMCTHLRYQKEDVA